MRILITAGPTREFIDPVRFISNSSTGFFGYEIAKVAAKRGHKVILVSGPTDLHPPEGVKFISVSSALEMKAAVSKFYGDVNCLIMSAAVADYRPARFISKKMKKDGERITLELKRSPDILLEAGKRKGGRVLVGFALETGNLTTNAKDKIKRKNLDFIVAAALNKKNEPFGEKRSSFIIMDKEGKIERFASSKQRMSKIIIDKVEKMRYSKAKEA